MHLDSASHLQSGETIGDESLRVVVPVEGYQYDGFRVQGCKDRKDADPVAGIGILACLLSYFTSDNTSNNRGSRVRLGTQYFSTHTK